MDLKTGLIKSTSISLDGENLVFDYRRAVFWPKIKALIIADLHIGKSGHFRKNGIAVSNSVSIDDFKRLDALIKSYSPKTLMILGDLSHSKMNKDWEHLLELRTGYPNLKILLVPGNHDILPKSAYDEAEIQQTEPIHEIDPFIFIHESKSEINANSRQFSGHIHPGVRLKGAARQGITLPCFCISDSNIILPAFSGFTGRYKIKPKKNDTILALTSKGMFHLGK
ncbi:ligase-associated DNA damage response endonuclease PdeM [Hyphobacterium sp. CCMP332]|nr:ligase-associated DNA damage response endonuclease PdeM [Hyphobacterium sp. CCMP332]